jgi:GNAT superfamily N-acetyltransferase
MTFRIRSADPATDRATMLSFIDGLQAFEHGLEPNRRLDRAVAADHMAVLDQRLAEHGGEIFIAQDDAGPLGWAVVHETVDDVYVIEAERCVAYIAELFLIARARGTGLGRALMAACEDWAKGRGVRVLRIGVLPGNARARAVYEMAGFAPYALDLRKYL